jgi:hypothetical protein
MNTDDVLIFSLQRALKESRSLSEGKKVTGAQDDDVGEFVGELKMGWRRS